MRATYLSTRTVLGENVHTHGCQQVSAFDTDRIFQALRKAEKTMEKEKKTLP